MEILYGTTMAAVFVLCLALLWTARRILRSSPLTSGELSLAHFDTTTQPLQFDDEIDYNEREADFQETAMELPEPMVYRDETLTTLTSPVTTEMPASAVTLEEPLAVPTEVPAQPVMDVSVTEATAPEEFATKVRTKTATRERKHLHGYNYLLECLLIGVSVVVLVQTQRSSFRYRSLPSSNRVA